MLSKIKDYIKENKSDMSKIRPILDISKEMGYVNPTLIDSFDDAKKIVDYIEAL